jgi:ATP-dependent exoDNAse (exonuclease V) beta subunit
MSSQQRIAPPDQDQRERALNPYRSILVQAPAGSGKTDLLTRRFLRLLAEVDEPSQIVAITFTKAAAAEMRHRIVAEIEKAERRDHAVSDDDFSIEVLARRALQRSRELGWDLVQLPSQLRISTIDAFCRELAIQQPLLSGLGGGLEIAQQPGELYRRTARRTLEQLGSTDPAAAPLLQATETLLLWRDNNWQDLEDQLVEMLGQRDRWMQGFVLESEQDWDALRDKLERPFARVVTDALQRLDSLFAQQPHALDEAVALARFACEQSEGLRHQELAEHAEFPCGPFADGSELEEARRAWVCVAELLLTKDGHFRQSVTKGDGFPRGCALEKQRFEQLVNALGGIEGLESALGESRRLPGAHYTEDEWKIVRACFMLLRQAAGELQVVFAESGTVDYIEVAQLAQRILEDADGQPTDAALAIADGIHHLLVDEFQDTSRRQHKLIGSLVAAWPDPAGRTVFVVGDPMQSIYFFRDADAELFPRVRSLGLDLPSGETHLFEFAPLASNFRTAPQLVDRLNDAFEDVFRTNDGSGIRFSRSQPVRPGGSGAGTHFALHIDFVPQMVSGRTSNPDAARAKEAAAKAREDAQIAQTRDMVSLIRKHRKRMEKARLRGEKYRIAVLGRARPSLAPVAQALRDAAIPFRAVDLEPLAERQEVLDALALARALLNPEDRVAWLGLLRAPWCGLSLKDLYLLTGADDPSELRTPIPVLLRERAALLSLEGQRAVNRLTDAFAVSRALRSSLPTTSIGTWLKMAWERMGGDRCATPAELVNLKLLWTCLDALPDGEPDLLGSSLNSALDLLTAQPDPDATGDWGVQVMTIHKSKGLEFEVVIVPELQAPTARPRRRMLTWLERGLQLPGDSGEITEFLIAPVQRKGEDRGRAKLWVDSVYRKRETQEIRRILYVAATRAREELHLFARAEFKRARNGEQTLRSPRESLLSAAWPALEREIQMRFAALTSAPERAELVSLAAQGENNLVQMALPFSVLNAKPAVLRRLPFDYQPSQVDDGSPRSARSLAGDEAEELYQRHEGGAASRALGTAVHAFFEELARLTATLGTEAARAELGAAKAKIEAKIRTIGMARPEAERLASQALEIAVRASQDPIAQWILGPRPGASSETRWMGMIGGSLRTVQVDRIFRAGPTPPSEGDETWWIVDYKTAYEKSADPRRALAELRSLFAPQLETYAEVLRNLHGTDARVCAGLYYPRMLRFDWWEIPASKRGA